MNSLNIKRILIKAHNKKHINGNISGQLTITFGSFVGIIFFLTKLSHHTTEMIPSSMTIYEQIPYFTPIKKQW